MRNGEAEGTRTPNLPIDNTRAVERKSGDGEEKPKKAPAVSTDLLSDRALAQVFVLWADLLVDIRESLVKLAEAARRGAAHP